MKAAIPSQRRRDAGASDDERGQRLMSAPDRRGLAHPGRAAAARRPFPVASKLDYR